MMTTVETAGTGAPWQLEFKTVEERYGYLLTSGLWADCTFMVGPKTNQAVIPAHKLILAMTSPVFEAMFFGGISEDNDSIIPIPDVQPEAFKALLPYIYTGNVNISSIDMAFDLWYGAKKYMLPHLVKKCNSYVLSKVVPKNAWRAYEFAQLSQEKILVDKCIEIISTNIKEVINDASFEDVEINTLITVLALEHLNVESELDLFHAVERYAKVEQKRQGQIGLPEDAGTHSEKLSDSLETQYTDKENFKEERPTIRNALQKIRFLSLTPQQFAEGLAHSDLLTKEEKFALLMNSASTECAVPMPTGFCESRERRQPRSNTVEKEPLTKLHPMSINEVRVVADPKVATPAEAKLTSPTEAKLNTSAEAKSTTSETKLTTATKAKLTTPAEAKLTTPAEVIHDLTSCLPFKVEAAARAAREMTSGADPSDYTAENRVQLGGGDRPTEALDEPWARHQFDPAAGLTTLVPVREHTTALVNGGAVPVLVRLLGRGGVVAEQAAWTLGNIAGGGLSLRDAVVDAGALQALLAHLKPSTPATQLRCYLWAYKIICKSAWYRLRFQSVAPVLPCITNLLALTDEHVLVEACWFLFFVTTRENYAQLFTRELTTRIIAVLAYPSPRVQFAALRTLVFMLGTRELKGQCLEAGCVDHINNFLKCGMPSYAQEAALGAVYILNGTESHIQLALDKGILFHLGNILTVGNDECKWRAAGAITIFCEDGSDYQLGRLEVSVALEPYCRLVESPYRGTHVLVLQGLTNLLQRIHHNQIEGIRLKLKEIGLPELLRTSQHEEPEFREAAAHLMEKYFAK